MRLHWLVLAGLLLQPVDAKAQDHWSAEVTTRLERGGERLKPQGYAPAGIVSAGSLFVDEKRDLAVPAAAGMESLFLGACDPDCTGLALVLTDSAGYQLDADRGPGITPVVRLPAGSLRGPFKLTVILSGCRVSPCRYAVARYARRPSRPPPAGRAE
ncbi:MAG: hypothetical protein U0133_11395 [Gemmatimonadales bacterium]